MATTKKSTKAKTKTVAAKTAKATTAKKTTKTVAKTTKKAPTKAPVKASVTKVAVTQASALSTLKNLNLISVLVSLLLIAAAVLLMSNTSYEIVSGLMVKNELATDNSAAFIPAVHHVYDLQLRWAVVAILGLGAVVPFLHATIKKGRYAEALKNKVNPMRWIEVGVIGALMVEVAALLSGINDILTLKLLSGSVLLGAALAWVAEKRNVQASRPVKSELVISMFANALPWVVIAGFAINTWAYGLIRSPWYVYTLYSVVIGGSIGYCTELKGWVKGKTTDYVAVERNYVVLGILVKLAFAAVLISGFAK